jgi:thiamine-monophosphate kinase
VERLSDIGEFALIERLKEIFGAETAPYVEIGIGDDAAVLNLTPGARLVVTTDALIEDVHFVLDRIEPRVLGRRAVAANLSDIAAMGARPRCAFVVLGLRPHANVDYVLEIARGMAELALEYDARIVGGDITRSPNALSLTLTVIGETTDGLLTRSGARPGDAIMVTGHLGGSAAGLGIAANPSVGVSMSRKEVDALLKRHNDPTPRVREGIALAGAGLATSAIDVSDGLAGDLRHICEMSRVGASIDPEKIPIDRSTHLAAGWLGQDAIALALTGGEDYELIFTCPADGTDAARAAIAPTPATEIGVITDEPGLRLVGASAPRYERYLRSFDHFKR